jgi:hypothetical protein
VQRVTCRNINTLNSQSVTDLSCYSTSDLSSWYSFISFCTTRRTMKQTMFASSSVRSRCLISPRLRVKSKIHSLQLWQRVTYVSEEYAAFIFRTEDLNHLLGYTASQLRRPIFCRNFPNHDYLLTTQYPSSALCSQASSLFKNEAQPVNLITNSRLSRVRLF